MLGNRTEGDKAKRMRREKMITGTNSRNNGGGGSGGRTSGSTRSKIVNTSINMFETTLKDKEPTGGEVGDEDGVVAIGMKMVLWQSLAKLHRSKEGRSPLPLPEIKPRSDGVPLRSLQKTCCAMRDKVPKILEEDEEEFEPSKPKLATCSPFPIRTPAPSRSHLQIG
ncbi:hypothetical protein D8674_011560 [Pyrus ussuriensis x Pyrus communis]|uniref:Uncharacterized protein n=1 Tax=Pyrus ussuriensis x Pyrus communis TaxID=2448454 RepID=A0A5N5G4P1_9ROSA|nr:hypothetical protein D8674_011560 [Pyrus ussuriensis x Pyrus communis]